jgi:hypothetical protein
MVIYLLFEIKAASTVTSDDFKHIRFFKEKFNRKFRSRNCIIFR